MGTMKDRQRHRDTQTSGRDRATTQIHRAHAEGEEGGGKGGKPGASGPGMGGEGNPGPGRPGGGPRGRAQEQGLGRAPRGLLIAVAC